MNDITPAPAIITRARALLAAATPGPWEALNNGAVPVVEAANKMRGMRAAGDPYPTVARMPKSYNADIANAALIAAAPEIIAALCDDLERLRARKAEVCDCVHATGMIGESFVDVDDDCPKCRGAGAVVVEGGE